MAFVLASPTTERENYNLSFVQNEPKEAELALDRFKVFSDTLDDISNKDTIALKIDPFPISNENNNTNNETDASTDSETETSLSSSKEEPYSQVLRNKIIETKRKKYNSKCADCLNKYPSYVVINLSIFVCKKCYLHHQALGYDVKSINYDNFTLNEVKKIQKNGNNKKSNKTYLAKYKNSNNNNKNQQYIF
eukprot:730363_1